MTHDDFLDPGTAERLLDGSVAPADAPPGFGPVAELLDAARGGTTPPAADVGALASAARAGAAAGAPVPPTPGRPPVLAKFLTLKAAAVAGVVLLGATSAAAATGSLPGPLQRTAHSTLSHVGVTVPSADDDANEPAEANHDATEVEDPTTTTTAPADPNAVPPADPATAGSDDAAEHNGQPEVEDESGDDHGQDAADDQDDDHGTTVTTQPSSGTGSQSGDDHEDGDSSGSGSSGSGSSGSGSSGHGGGED